MKNKKIISLLLALIFALGIIPAFAPPATAASGGTTIDMADTNPPSSGTGWTYASNSYTILDGANVIVTGSNGGSQRYVAVAMGATVTVTLDNASIINTSSYFCPFASLNNTNVTLNLKGNNILTAGLAVPGLWAAEGSSLTINGPGSLTATGGDGGAGIGADEGFANGNITINSGTVEAIAGGSGNSAAIGRGHDDGGGVYIFNEMGVINIVSGFNYFTNTTNSEDGAAASDSFVWSDTYRYIKIVPHNPVISVNTQPAAATNLTAGSISGSLSVTASATLGAELSYQWYSNTSASNTGGTAVSGATGASFTIPTALTEGTYYYYCVVSGLVSATGGAASVASNTATVTVEESSEPEPSPEPESEPSPEPEPEPEPGDDSQNSGTISLTDSSAPHINLAAETISLPFTVAAYSIDGGKKWKKGELPTDTKWYKLFDNKKGLELWVTNAWNDKDIKEDKKVVEKKGVPSGATIIKFPKIDGRPKANQEKVAPWYGTGTETSFVLSKKGKTFSTPTSVYEYAETSDGKTASGAWAIFKDGLSIPDSGKVTWLFRSPPTVEGSKYTPGSKAFKLNAVAYVKTPNYKAPTEAKAGKPTLLKLKKGDFCLVMIDGEVKIFGSATAKTDIKIVGGTPGANEIPSGTSVSIWKAATGKKPRSSAQELTMPTITPPT
ncbi:MAG: hypothetical protein FWG36_01270 [Oscillospiraceae bacterium]|nr:hypothetical protein [Oscillospiraceae bacterium]